MQVLGINKYPRYLVLILTEACNLRCVYCYRGDPGGLQYMSRDIAEAGIRLAASSGLPFHVQMTGGEPTLEPGLIERVAGLIRKEAWPATIGMQTNGTLLDRAITGIFKKYDIQVGVSLDGPPEVQERVRGRAASTLKGLKLLRDQDMAFRVTTVITGQNVHAMGQLALLLGGFPNACGLGLDLLIARGRAVNADTVMPPSPKDLKNGLKKLLQALNWVNEKRPHPVKLRELELLKQAAAGKRNTSFCHAARGEAMAVLPDGTVYPCAQTAGDPRFACGTVEAVEKENLYSLGQYSLQNEQCNNCPLFEFCPGDCPGRLHYNNSQTGRLACVMYQTLWKEYIEES